MIEGLSETDVENISGFLKTKSGERVKDILESLAVGLMLQLSQADPAVPTAIAQIQGRIHGINLIRDILFTQLMEKKNVD